MNARSVAAQRSLMIARLSDAISGMAVTPETVAATTEALLAVTAAVICATNNTPKAFMEQVAIAGFRGMSEEVARAVRRN